MHYHCEIVLPPQTDAIETAIESVMKPFDENLDPEEANLQFWDWYEIGGRWAGSKLMAGYDKSKLDEFHEWMKAEGVTVSSIQCGKQELKPKSQIEKVDAKWNDMFPSSDGVMVACPLFQHSPKTMQGDICPLGNAKDVSCQRVIFTGPAYNHKTKEHTGPLEAVFMMCDEMWNGVNWMDVEWEKTIADALRKFEKRLAHYRDEYRELITPTDEWITVTVDYHT